MAISHKRYYSVHDLDIISVAKGEFLRQRETYNHGKMSPGKYRAYINQLNLRFLKFFGEIEGVQTGAEPIPVAPVKIVRKTRKQLVFILEDCGDPVTVIFETKSVRRTGGFEKKKHWLVTRPITDRKLDVAVAKPLLAVEVA